MSSFKRPEYVTREPLLNARSANGVYLVELLVAVFISSLMAGALAQSMSEMFKMSNYGQNQLVASAIAQELVDNARNMTYYNANPSVSNLCSLIGGTYILNVNSANPSSPVNTRPLMLDHTNLDWTQEAEDNQFVGTVSQTVTNAGWGSYAYNDPVYGAVQIPNGVKVDITINWTETGKAKSYLMTTYISRNGIHTY